MYGEGKEVGPDITSNGRASFDQLLSNVFDPSLVIGKDYRPLTVATADGRVVSGLVVEDSDQRVVLKVQGGKLETIARKDVESSKQSQVSLMPEGIRNTDWAIRMQTKSKRVSRWRNRRSRPSRGSSHRPNILPMTRCPSLTCSRFCSWTNRRKTPRRNSSPVLRWSSERATSRLRRVDEKT